MLQTSSLLIKSLSKTETPIFLSVMCSLFPKAIFLTFIKRNSISHGKRIGPMILWNIKIKPTLSDEVLGDILRSQHLTPAAVKSKSIIPFMPSVL